MSHRIGGCLGAVRRARLRKDADDMVVYGARAYHERRRNLVVSLASGYEVQRSTRPLKEA